VLCNGNNKQEGEAALLTPSKGHVLLLQEGFSLSLWVIVALCFFCNKDNKPWQGTRASHKQEGEAELVTPSKGQVLRTSLWVIVALCFFCNKDNKPLGAFFAGNAFFCKGKHVLLLQWQQQALRLLLRVSLAW